jgi:hypothetical protein
MENQQTPTPAAASVFDTNQRQALIELALLQPRIYQRQRPTYQQLLEMPDAELMAAAGFTAALTKPLSPEERAGLMEKVGPAAAGLSDRELARAGGFEPLWPVTLSPEALAALEQLQAELLGGLIGEGIARAFEAQGATVHRPAKLTRQQDASGYSCSGPGFFVSRPAE